MLSPEYNKRAEAAGLWAAADLPPKLAIAYAVSPAAFAAAVAVAQRAAGIVDDGKLGPNTWRKLTPRTQPAPGIPAPFGARVDSRVEAIARFDAGLALSPHLKGHSETLADILQGKICNASAQAVYKLARYDGQRFSAAVYARGPKEGARAYKRKGRTAAEMRRSYRKWAKHIDPLRRGGMGVHWTGGRRDVDAALRYLLTKPGKVSSNVGISHDGSPLIVFPTLPEALSDLPEPLLFTAHGAHNPACFGVDLPSPGWIYNHGGHWGTRSGALIAPEIIAACGVVHLPDASQRAWLAGKSDAVPWGYRKKPGKVYAKHFLAPSWESLAMLVIIGRIHSHFYKWTNADVVTCGHYQRTDSRADHFIAPLKWVREACLTFDNLLKPSAWLARWNPSEVSQATQGYRNEVVGTCW